MARDEAKWAHWAQVIHDWRASGLTRNAYCRREGTKPSTLDYWRPLIDQDPPRTAAPAEAKSVKKTMPSERITLVPVKVIDAARDATSEVLTLKSPSGWEVRLPAQADPNWLIKVLRQLP